MLQGFRTIINSVVGKVFFAVLVGTFGLLGVGYGFRDLVLSATSANDAAKVGGTAISLNQLSQEYHRQLQALQRNAPGGFNPTPQQKQEIAQAVLDRMVNDTLLDSKAAKDGFRISDVLVRDVVQSEPAFAGMDHRFDPGRFRMLLENQGMSEAYFANQVRQNLARQLLINPIAESATAPKALVADIYRYRNEQRVAQTVAIPNASATNVAPPSDADIEAYYQKHAVEFTAPEYRAFTVLPLGPGLFEDEITPSDDDLRAAYESHKADFVAPEKRKITQIVLPDQAAADAVAKAVQSGKSLADAAGSAKAQPVTLDFLAQAEFPEALRTPVFAAAKGATVGPVQTPLGWHVVHVDDIQPGHVITFDDAKPKLIAELKREGAADRLSDQIDKIGDKLSAGASMEDVATSLNAKTIKVPAVDATGEPAVKDSKFAKPPVPWVALAFDLHQGETSAFQDAKDGSYFAVRLDSVTPPALKPLAEVKADIVAAWTRQRRAEETAKRAEALAAKARAGTPMDQIASEAGVKLETTPALTRGTQAAGISPALVSALFGMEKVGDVTVADTGDAHVIVRLSEIKEADPKAAGAALGTIAREVSTAMQGDDLAQYRIGLRQDTRVKINPDAVQQVAGQ